jgi:hypothetical protein
MQCHRDLPLEPLAGLNNRQPPGRPGLNNVPAIYI